MVVVSPLALYIHVPFCSSKCFYCDFYSCDYAEELAQQWADAVVKEWLIVKKLYGLSRAYVSTLYFGGGTPSLLPVQIWKRLQTVLIETLAFDPRNGEWTIECNPDSFSTDKAQFWLAMGVTRIVVGIQSLDERELRFLGRHHSAAQALGILCHPLLDRFRSVGVDLIYGLPGQSVETLRKTLRSVLAHTVISHLSAYELTLHHGTPLGERTSQRDLPNEATILSMMDLIEEECEAHGLFRYEISNYAKKGHACRHNIAYWTHAPYIGLGPAAHSFILPQRWANVSDLSSYLSAIRCGKLCRAFEETLSGSSLGREAIFLGLRTDQGIDEQRFAELSGTELLSGQRREKLHALRQAGLIDYQPPYWRCTKIGWPKADAIARWLGAE